MRQPGEQIVIGSTKYIIARCITRDRGDGASFYEALEPSLGRKVGLKELRGDARTLAAAEKELQAITLLSHPQIPQVLQRHRTRDSVFLVLQYIEGMSLRDYISRGGSVDTPSAYRNALGLMIDVCNILQHIHRQRYYHRDLTPANIIVRGSRCYLIDFGVTVAPRRVLEGTEGYAAPEQERPEGLRRTLRPTVDVFAVGRMTMELLTDRQTSLRKHPRRDEWRDPYLPTELNDRLPPLVDEVILKAISYLPEARHQDARSLRFDLQRLRKLDLKAAADDSA